MNHIVLLLEDPPTRKRYALGYTSSAAHRNLLSPIPPRRLVQYTTSSTVKTTLHRLGLHLQPLRSYESQLTWSPRPYYYYYYARSSDWSLGLGFHTFTAIILVLSYCVHYQPLSTRPTSFSSHLHFPKSQQP